MLDTNICSFIMRERPIHLLKVLQAHVENKDRIVVSAITYAEMRFGASDKGTPIGANDTAIAGHAIASDCVLVTNNTKEFERVPALHLDDWTK
jgi:tRNA(fMet)-specific endonuclease VapC